MYCPGYLVHLFPGLQERDECLYILQMYYLDDESRIYGKLLTDDAELIECIQYLIGAIKRE